MHNYVGPYDNQNMIILIIIHMESIDGYSYKSA